jgi:hypothetical protein
LIQSEQALEEKMRRADAAGLSTGSACDRRSRECRRPGHHREAGAGRERSAEDVRASSTRRSFRDSDKARFKSLGVIASIQPSHCIDDMRWAEKRIGRERVKIAYDFKSFVDAGARVAFGTDWFVEPLNPMLGLYAAVTRTVSRWDSAGRLVP